MFVLVTDHTLRKDTSANDQGIVAVTGRAHCQRQVAFFVSKMLFFSVLHGYIEKMGALMCILYTGVP